MFTRYFRHIFPLGIKSRSKGVVDPSCYVEESLSMYKPGGFHPVRIGDSFCNARYQVVRKLGWGMWATVWLARDTLGSRYVAIKINRADMANLSSPDELGLMKAIEQSNQCHPGRHHVVQLLDHFRHTGPNGTHICLVMDVFGPNLEDILKIATALSIPTQKHLINQILLGLDFLHRSCHIIHTDLKSNNLFLEVPNIENVISTDLANFPIPSHTEKYFPVTVSQPLTLDIGTLDQKSIVVKIGDLGGGCFENSVSEHFAVVTDQPIHPAKMRAPEVLIGAPWDISSDIWCLGCMVFEITMGGHPFMVIDDPEKSYLAAAGFMQAVLGPFPRYIIEKGRRRDQFFKIDGSFLFETEPTPWFDKIHKTRIKMGEPADKADMYISFLQNMLKMDPHERGTAQELLAHPWLVENGVVGTDLEERK